MSALPPKADMRGANEHVCFGPKADIERFQTLKSHPRTHSPYLSTSSSKLNNEPLVGLREGINSDDDRAPRTR
jgi:hypothetical protein